MTPLGCQTSTKQKEYSEVVLQVMLPKLLMISQSLAFCSGERIMPLKFFFIDACICKKFLAFESSFKLLKMLTVY